MLHLQSIIIVSLHYGAIYIVCGFIALIFFGLIDGLKGEAVTTQDLWTFLLWPSQVGNLIGQILMSIYVIINHLKNKKG